MGLTLPVEYDVKCIGINNLFFFKKNPINEKNLRKSNEFYKLSKKKGGRKIKNFLSYSSWDNLRKGSGYLLKFYYN